MKKFLLRLIRFYQQYLSLDQGALRKVLGVPSSVRICRFSPSCSEYTYQAIDKYGVLQGSIKGSLRILRCNPFFKGGLDPLK